MRKISFTGSTEVGKELIRASADQVKRLSLELGGHAPFVVFEDADIEQAVDDAMASKYRNAGQTCVCANRIYVQRSIHGEFVKELARRAAAMKVGNGREEGVVIGPLIDDRGVAKAEEHVKDAVAKGADLVVGGHRLTDGAFGAGSFYEPTVLDNVTEDMLIYREETFGPVAGVTVFDTEDDAIRMANDTIYGLAAYFHTRDYARLLRVAERLEYGIVGANDGIISSAAAPFGGIKESGFGREGGPQGIDEYLDVKYVSIGHVGTPAYGRRSGKRRTAPALVREPGAAFRGERGRGRSSPSLVGSQFDQGVAVVQPDATPEEGGVIRSEEQRWDRAERPASSSGPLRGASGVGRGGLLRALGIEDACTQNHGAAGTGLERQLLAKCPQQTAECVDGRGDAVALDARDRRLRRVGALREFLLRDVVALTDAADELAGRGVSVVRHVRRFRRRLAVSFRRHKSPQTATCSLLRDCLR